MAAEARLQTKVRNFAKRCGIETIRLAFAPGVTAGWPDMLFLIPGGRPLFLEYKAPGRKPSPRQLVRINTLLGLGYDVHAVDNFDTARKAVTSALERARLPAAGG